MKLRFLLYSLLFFFIACSPSPKKTADEFLSNLNEKKIESLLSLCTPEMKMAFSGLAASITPKDMKEKFHYEILDEITTGEMSIVKAKIIAPGKPDRNVEIKMLKSNGKWLVAGFS